MNKEAPRVITDPRNSDANVGVRKNVETAADWQFQEMATTLYRWADVFTERFLRPIEIPGQPPVPATVISFEAFDHRSYAYYRLGRNPQGLLYEITLNTVHLGRPLWNVLETLLHEQVHLWQQNFGEHPIKRNYHNEEFVLKCEQFGLHPVPGIGCHYKPADGPFAQLMVEHGIEKPEWEEETIGPEDKRNWWEKEKKEGRSTLSKWECPCGCKIRVGRQDFPGAICKRCGKDYVRIDGKAEQVVFTAKKDETAKTD